MLDSASYSVPAAHMKSRSWKTPTFRERFSATWRLMNAATGKSPAHVFASQPGVANNKEIDMKRFLIMAAVAAATIATQALAADVGISISIGQPGFYGRLDIGGYPPPQVIYRQPIAVEQVPMDRPPIYLRVPLAHAKHWRRYCHQYNACGERVFFVQDGWYNRQYVPRYREQHRDRRDAHREGHRENYQGGHRGDEHDRDR
jgi:hypothetical protein